MSAKLYAIYIKPDRGFIGFYKKKIAHFGGAWKYVLEVSLINLKDIPKNSPPIRDIENMRDLVFVETVYIYWNSLTEREREDMVEKCYLSKWAHYFAIMSVCTLAERLVIIRNYKAGLSRQKYCAKKKFNKFCECILKCLRNRKLSFKCGGGNIVDLLDLTLIIYLFESTMALPNLCFTKEISDKYLHLITLVNSEDLHLPPLVLPTCKKNDVLSQEASGNAPKRCPTLAAITSRLSEEYAGEVKKTLQIVKDFSGLIKGCTGYAFDETYHWHSGKQILDDIDHKEKCLSKIPRIRQYELKQIQKFNGYLMMYGETLDKSIDPVVIVTDTTKFQPKKTKLIHPTKTGQKKSEKKKGKTAQDIIKENNDRKKLADMEKVSSQWEFRKVEVENIKDTERVIKVVSDFVNTFLSLGIAYEEPKLYLLKLQYKRWKKVVLKEINYYPMLLS